MTVFLNFLRLKNNNDSTDQPCLFCQEILLGTNFMIISYDITFMFLSFCILQFVMYQIRYMAVWP
jgi:hypothetical protein